MDRVDLEETAENLAEAGRAAMERGRQKEAARRFRECLAVLKELQAGPETSELWLLEEGALSSIKELAEGLGKRGDRQTLVPW